MLFAVDTATVTASIALYDLANGLLLGESTWQARRRHTQDLLLTTQALMAQLGVQPAQLTGLAVTTGPGSFTGVRIAISLVKGIGIGLSTPPQVVGLPTLTVTAAPWLAVAQATSAVVWAYIQAGRGRYNWAIFDQGLYAPGAADHQAGSAADFATALAAHADHPIWLIGEAASDLRAAVSSLRHVTLVDGISAMRRAGVLAHLAAQRIAAGQVDELTTLQPLYLQGP
ncbi:MAG: tRNA (adenosine(37)-N6)-threonylcarbamoyltransferase complex dimerization subunit type 1 TsaB [Caldilineaceae bacterium]|nr:tRNA (adenosine(37)-N6)-threonylcarbamoyltransferase complex dimerization subunit type 1 TsaB [Caldilineaceae bacterium]